MPSETLQRRSTQLALLGEACEAGVRGWITPRGWYGRRCAARLVSVDQHRLYLAVDRAFTPPESARHFLVGFERDGTWYEFTAERDTQAGKGGVSAGVLVVGVPLCVRRRAARGKLRVKADPRVRIDVRFTSMLDDARRATARLRDLSATGLGVVVSGTLDMPFRRGEPFWAELELPGGGRSYEFPVRIAHMRPVDAGMLLGWTLYPCDDAAVFHHTVAEVVAWITEHAPSHAT